MAEYSILIVEDERTLRRLLEYRLGKEYNVRTAENGIEALELLSEEVPDLIISDVMMPKMDGFALQAAVQERQDTKATPFIFLTAKVDEDSRKKGQMTGVDDYITKPFDIDQLISRVNRLIERTKVFQTQLDEKIGQDFSQKLTPKTMPSVSGYTTHVHNVPKGHGGGDIFDWTETRPGTYFITIGDVMGKGLQAKFYAFSFYGYIRSTIHTMLGATDSPAELVAGVNKALVNDTTMEDTFASLLLIRWEPERNTITYANAGHCRPILVSERGAEVITYSDIVLGLTPDAEFKDTSIVMKPGTALVAYTDGVTEQVTKSDVLLGEEGVVDVIQKAYGHADPLDAMATGILDVSKQQEFSDDVLIFWLQRLTAIDRQTPRWFSPFRDVAKGS
ncbi:MAG: fused response regulator/phosphatase [Bacteroidetes bacterium]|nr:MAG: fused response regulator/phosphatase [Bacteroidota bacterium]